MKKRYVSALLVLSLATLVLARYAAQASELGAEPAEAAETQTFADVPPTHPYYAQIEWLYQNGYTAGCAVDPLRYCPDATMNRAESAVFVGRGIHGANYEPASPSVQVFADVPLDSWAAKWVNGLWQDQYAAGCGTNPLIYCPWQGHTRAEGSVFYLRMMHGAGYVPPEPVEQSFADVPLDAWYAGWVQAASEASLIPACQTSPDLRFCPDGPLSRGLAAYMMFQAKSVQASGRVFYVAPDGADSNPGTVQQPWKSINYGVGKLAPGDTLYVRGGTYTQQSVSVTVSGTATAPITISGYPNETVVLDGKGTFPSSDGSYMIVVRGNWVTVKDMEIANSGQSGVFSGGTHVTVQNMNIHHCQDAAITLTGDYDLALGNRAWSDGLVNENNKSGPSGGWPAIITCARYPQHCTLRGNTVSASWGEGISTFEATYTTIEDNVSYNNQQNFYISDTKYTVMQRNISYCTPGNAIDPYMTQNGILVGDEKGVPIDGVRYPSSDNKILNNLVMGCDRNLAAGTSVSTNNLYAYNTFVNSGGDATERANVLIYVSGSCSNCRFSNNLILQETSTPITLGGGVNNGWTFSNNLWSRAPGTNFGGSADVIADPLLEKLGLTGPGQLTANFFRIAANSPAIDKGKVLSDVGRDFFQSPRGAYPDIGAHEYGQ